MPRTDNFQKFVKQKKSGAVKEELRQQKRKEKKERAEAIEAHFERKRAERQQKQTQAEAPPARAGRPNKYPKKVAAISPESTPVSGKFVKKTVVSKEQISTAGKFAKKTLDSKKPFTATGKFVKKAEARTEQNPSAGKFTKEPSNLKEQTPVADKFVKKAADIKKPIAATGKSVKKEATSLESKKDSQKGLKEQMPLNKYIAHGGICSRRDAAILVKEGKVTVNNELATDPGMKILENDVVKVGNKKIIPSRNFVYILLNKPKDYITTSEDPQGRKTVLDLVRTATDERVYPVGRLDRNTSGVLLLTNDGELAQKLSHPSHEVKKIYEVRLDKALTKNDLDKIASGITLEDGFVAPDEIAYADSKDKSIIGVEIHSGRNRIVRRIFESLKYDVKGLDRVMFAGLTKKDVQRGHWRHLKEKEVRILKFMNQSFVKTKD